MTWSALCFGSQSVWWCGEGKVRIEEKNEKSGKNMTHWCLVLEICQTYYYCISHEELQFDL